MRSSTGRKGGNDMREQILAAMEEAEQKAWESLAGYKFIMLATMPLGG